MSVKIRQIDTTRNIGAQIRLEALEKVVPLSAVEEALTETSMTTVRERKLNLVVTVLVVIAMNLFTGESIGSVLKRLCMGLRWLQLLVMDENLGENGACETDLTKVAGDGALSYRRYQLGVKPVVALFHKVCRPLAAEATPGAFLFGLRLMGLDGQAMTVADTPENAAYFGRMGSGRGDSAYPKVKGVYLCELGTHAIVDAGFWPSHVSEEIAAYRLLRSVHAGMLVMYDQGLWAAERAIAIRRRGAHILCRLPSTVKPRAERPLNDGSHLVWVSPSSSRKLKQNPEGTNVNSKDRERLLVRLIEYTIDDPAMPGYGQTYRIITSLTDPDLYPARELAVAYHERWEIEMTFDELEVHQLRSAGAPLRSKKPVGVMQELYGLLIAHWVVRSLIFQASQRAGIDPDRISFVGALRIVCRALPYFQVFNQLLGPSVLPRLHRIMLADIAQQTLPPRKARSNPRVVKRRQSKFPVKREVHKAPPPLLKTFEQAIVLIGTALGFSTTEAKAALI